MEQYIQQLSMHALLERQSTTGCVSLQQTKELVTRPELLVPYVVPGELQVAFQAAEKKLARQFRVKRLLRDSGVSATELAQWGTLWQQRQALRGVTQHAVRLDAVSGLDDETLTALERFLTSILSGP